MYFTGMTLGYMIHLSRAKEPEIFRDSGSFSLFRLDLEAKGKHEEVQKTSQRTRAETNQYIFTKNLYKNPTNPLI